MSVFKDYEARLMDLDIKSHPDQKMKHFWLSNRRTSFSSSLKS